MKTLCLILLITSTIAGAQDRIITMKHDTIDCFITNVDERMILFKFDTSETNYKVQWLPNVLLYERNRKTVIIDHSKEVVISDEHREIKTAGDELIKASTHYYAGVAISIAGGGIMLLASSKPDNANKAVTYLGAGFALIGTILIIESHSHQAKAGRILNQYKVGFALNSNGASFSLKF